jgi:amidase
VDLERFPRRDVHFPEKKDNPHGAWAWKFDLVDMKPLSKNGILQGKTVAVKDNIAVKDIPMLLGTDFIRGFVPVSILNRGIER